MARVLSYAAAGLLLLTATRAFPRAFPQGLDCLKTGNLVEFAALTADDAVFVDAHGFASKAEVVKHTSEFLQLSSKSGLIAYKIAESGMSHGKQFKANVYVSSMWVDRKGKWLCICRRPRPDDLEV